MNRVPRTGEGWAGEAMDAIWGEDWNLPDNSTISGFLRDDVQIVSEDGLNLGVATILEVRKSERGTLANNQVIRRAADNVGYRVADMAPDSDGWIVCTLAKAFA